MKWHLRLVIFILSISVGSWAQSENEASQEVTAEAAVETPGDLTIDSGTQPTAEATATAESTIEPTIEKSTDPAVDTTTDAVVETAPDAAVEAVEPAAEASAEPATEPTSEVATDPAQSPSESSGTAGLVEFQYPNEYQGPYLESRGTHGFMFDVNYQSYVPKSLLSDFDQGTYKNIYENNPIPLVEVQLAYKYNFSLGSLTLGLGYGGGTTSSAITTKDRSITLTKASLAAGYIMDALFEEPYVAPYGQIQAWQMGIKEDSAGLESKNRSTQIGFAYTLGMLVQLNWLDESSAENGAHNFGLDNTYLDLFAVKYSKTQSVTDANTESDFNFGAGLRLEY